MPHQDIKELTIDELKSTIEGWGWPKFHTGQILSWAYQKNVLDFQKMSNLPVGLRTKLTEKFTTLSTTLKDTVVSRDGTWKFIFRLSDGNYIESVLIPEKNRTTACISTQVGCKFACKFCASGLSGFKRNLTSSEMLDQVLYLKNNSCDRKLTHIVFMGIGEPLDNYENVLKAIRVINSPHALNIAARRITISTSGLVPGIRLLAKEGLQVELSISLHAADDKTRDYLMPINKKYPLEELIHSAALEPRHLGRGENAPHSVLTLSPSTLRVPSGSNPEQSRKGSTGSGRMVSLSNQSKPRALTRGASNGLISACKDYIKATNRQITLEYVLIKRVNSDLQNAQNLCKITKILGLCKVNLIPVNPIEKLRIEPPGKLDILLFKNLLAKSGVKVTLRKSRGKDIEAACGQLKLKFINSGREKDVN